MCTRRPSAGFATVVSDTDLSLRDSSWSCTSVNELTQLARIVYWGRKIFEWIRTLPPVEVP